MVARVHGGIFTDQMLKGTITYYEMVGSFADTISDGTVIVPDQEVVGDETDITYEYIVGDGQPVPESAADRAFAVILDKCTVVQIGVLNDFTIQFAIENTDNAWNTTAEGAFDSAGLDTDSDAAANMEAAVQALGVQGTVTVPSDVDDTPPVIPDNTTTGTTVDLSTVTITEKEFILV